jgi:hypothetical protein
MRWGIGMLSALVIIAVVVVLCCTPKPTPPTRELSYFRPSMEGGRSLVVDDGVAYYYRSYDFGEEQADTLFEGNPYDPQHIVVSKEHQTVTIYDSQGGIICRYPVTVGRNFGNKQRPGDLKTPEGEFYVQQIQDASSWGHDTGDGNGYIPSSYGNWFVRLMTHPHYGIGIHATIRSHIVGSRASEGCITMHCNNLDNFRAYVREGMRVTVETSLKDMEADGRCLIISDDMFDKFRYYDPENRYRKVSGVVIQDVVNHVVVEGDDMLSLAVRYGTTRRNIEALNPNKRLDSLAVDDVIRVAGCFVVHMDEFESNPYLPPKSDAQGPQYYVTCPVDTFGRVAVMHATTQSRLKELNPDIDPEAIVAGMTIRVR